MTKGSIGLPRPSWQSSMRRKQRGLPSSARIDICVQIDQALVHRDSMGRVMRLCTFEYAGATEAGILKNGKILPISQLNSKRGANFPITLLSLIQSDETPSPECLGTGRGSGDPAGGRPPAHPLCESRQGMVYRPQLPLPRRGSERSPAGGARQLHEAFLVVLRARRRDRASARGSDVRRRRRGRVGVGVRQALPGRAARRGAQRALRLYHHAGHDRARYLGPQHLLPAALQELRHVLFLRAGHRHRGRDRRRQRARGPDNPQFRGFLARLCL